MTVFLILHYLSKEMTDECVSKLKDKIKDNNVKIIIVDNASSNGTGLQLKREYENDPQCEVLLNEKNIGFARGNNIGYQYARMHYLPDFVVIMNNDVLIEDEKFIDKIETIYKATKFDVMGPDILATRIGIHQNPMRIKPYSKKELEDSLNEKKRLLAHYKLRYTMQYFNVQIKECIKRILHWKSKSPENINLLYKENRIENPVLHGACLIFSKRFIKNEEVAFNPETFLFMEEDILHYTCRKKGYKLLYDSSVIVHHLEDVSTNLEYKTDYEKGKMKIKNLIHSINVLLKLMNEDENI